MARITIEIDSETLPAIAAADTMLRLRVADEIAVDDMPAALMAASHSTAMERLYGQVRVALAMTVR